MQKEEYIQALLLHDKKQLDKLYQEFTPKIISFIKKRGGTTEDAKDVFQDALMIIYHKAKSKDFELTSQFSTYLFGVCHFIWRKKKAKKDNNLVTIETDEGYIIESRIEKELFKREKERIFKEQFSKLGINCRKILTMFFDKKPMVEIAQNLGLKNEHSARNNKYRCQKKLEKLIKEDVVYKEIINLS